MNYNTLWHDLSNPSRHDAYHDGGGMMTKKEIVRALVLSPLYWKLKLKDRAYLIRKLIPRR
jgi:hypothetical protein